MGQEEDAYDNGDIVNDEDAEVFVMGENLKVECSQEACPKLLLKGQCWQRDCRFSHKSALINHEKDRLLQQWSDQKRPSTHVQHQRVQHNDEGTEERFIRRQL